MKRVVGLVAAFALAAVVASAHGNAVHVRGTITQIAGKSVTVQPTVKGAKAVTFIVADHTEIDRGTKVATLADLKVGDRVVVEIPKGKTEAESIKIGTSPVAKTSPSSAPRKSKG